MATKRMLIDASHPEETRVVVVDGNRLEEYDVEVASRRQLKGNIYLAKVTRVEPSLQAAFVDYGGNRHGFLAFSEIHPDYYQIPVADRQALLAEQAAAERANDDLVADADDDEDDLERRRPRLSARNYKIQEVIKRRQILLVQVTKEERGTKGAALTTYLSLAGRYCVLMPNTSRGGGISRKISNVTDRKRLKKIIAELEVGEGMAVIVRTAGAGRTKAEIKRDYEYLLRLWSNIREVTLQSTAPALVYEEGNLIKRSIRDLYGRDTEEILIQGEPQYRIAKEFMKLFIPSHAKRVKLYEDVDRPLFHHAQVEDQIEAMHQPIVHLRSGSYIVINPTEALVSIDVNSGRATRERHIEETALRTNLEAADEVARQLRMRDLAGLIVIDFIDMENARNQTQVERRLKEAMKNDRARIQIGRISPFGLLELSRQRMRPSLLETSFEPCPMCSGTGLTRTIESASLALLRRIEDEGIRYTAGEIIVTAGTAIALYLLNFKRRALSLIEQRYGFQVRVVGDPAMVGHDFKLERIKAPAAGVTVAPVRVEEEGVEAGEKGPEVPAGEPVEAESEEANKRGRRRRPRRKRRTEEERPEIVVADSELILAAEDEPGVIAESETVAAEAVPDDDAEGDDESEQAKKRRRRGKRGGRRRARRPTDVAATDLTLPESGDDGEHEAFAGAGDEDEGSDSEMQPPESEELAAEEAAEEASEVAMVIPGGDDTLAEGLASDTPTDTAVEPTAAADHATADSDTAFETVAAVVGDDEAAEEPARLSAETSTETLEDSAEDVSEASRPWSETNEETPQETVSLVVEAADEVAVEAMPEATSNETEVETVGGDDAETLAEMIEVRETAEASDAERPVEPLHSPSLSEPLPEEIAHTEAEHTGYFADDGEDEESHAPRRGWWQRLIT